MRSSTRFMITAAAVVCSAFAAPASAQVTVGTAQPDGGNCIPLGCNYQNFTRYQQVFASSAFAGPINIGMLTIFHTKVQPGLGEFAPGTYNFSLGTTSRGVNGLSTTFQNNVTGALSLFASVIIAPGSTANGTTFSVVGNPFLYNPLAGNLLVDLTFTNTNGSILTSFDADNSGTVTSRAIGLGSSGITDATGLVTRFDAAPTSVVPEPASLVLLASGLGVIGLGLRNRRRV